MSHLNLTRRDLSPRQDSLLQYGTYQQRKVVVPRIYLVGGSKARRHPLEMASALGSCLQPGWIESQRTDQRDENHNEMLPQGARSA